MADGGAPKVSFGSVCSGIEAASVAWHPLGWRAAWLAEIEPFPAAVLAHHYPDVPNLGDMRSIATRVLRGAAPAPDVLVGGTPCQAFSVAGLRESLADERGNLTLKFVELADAIDHVRRARGDEEVVIVWENVPGVLSTKDNAFGCFLAGLAGEDVPLEPPGRRWPDAGCVYGPSRAITWRALDAQYFGLAQRRRRVFVVASARNGFDPAQVLFEWEGMRRDSPPSRETREDVTGTLSSRTTGGGGFGTDFECSGGLVAAFGGNNQSGPIDVATARNACASASGRMDFETETFIVQPPALSVALRGRDGGSTAELGDDLAGCLRASSGGGDKPHVLAPVAIAFNSLQDPVSSEHCFGALVSSSPQAQDVCVTGDITHTLRAEGFDASEDGSGRGQPIVAAFAENSRAELRYEGGDGEITGALKTGGGKAGQSYPVAQVGMSVRRLTPVECERLQGFPDGYTQIPLRNKNGKLNGKWAKDGPRYKALGNSMAVPVMQWIGRRIAAALLRDRA